ncbi:helix-turn-helix domain-containing protein [Blautia marasmi]|nr:helix-turn-helix domain-containing protein [Blautia marasmi]
MVRALLNVHEVCNYLGIGETKVREIMKDSKCSFSLKIGGRWYANKKLLDEWLEECTKRIV